MLRRITQSEVTRAIGAEASRIIKAHHTEPYGTEIPFMADGKPYVARIEKHYHDPNGKREPRGHHKGVSVFVEDGEKATVMQVLKLGVKGEAAERWQSFLRGLGYELKVDGDFGPKTHGATVAYQRQQGLKPDGIVGNRTYAVAMAMGFALVDQDEPELPRPQFAPLGQIGRERVYGKFAYVAAPTEGNPEGIRIIDDWVQQNIVLVEIPQLERVQGAPSTKVKCHRLVAPKLRELFVAWERAGLMRYVLTWGGLWVPRYIRGSRTTLSSHAHASAFDINAAWNGLGKVPAAPGHTGSVRELVPIANDLGWFWGGHFTRQDGMHFELVDTGENNDTMPAPPPEEVA